MNLYEPINKWKKQQLQLIPKDVYTLNHIHDEAMNEVLHIAISIVGTPPCPFTWFITGSGGRFEQSFISDQDHGLLYAEESPICKYYFKKLGEEVSFGLAAVGYPYCKGNIMSSNPLWCQSFENWQKQLDVWITDSGWDAIRYLQIFYDARALYQDFELLEPLKRKIHTYCTEHSYLLNLFAKNSQYTKKVVGPLGQFIPERYGPYQGSIDLKYSAFMPYVNAIRLLAIKEGVYETSTLARIKQLQQLQPYVTLLQNCYDSFELLLHYRLLSHSANTYEDVHFFNISQLSPIERKQLKQIIKTGIYIHQMTLKQIKKGC